MARLNINIGTTANDKTGDPLRTAFDKVNQNFVELYAHVGVDTQIPSQSGNNGKYLTTNGTTLSWSTVNQFSGSYTDLTNKPTIPTLTSDLTNDSNFVVKDTPPTTLQGASGDVAGLVAFDNNYIYYCTDDYVSVGGGGGASVTLVPNQLGQTVNSLSIDKSGPSNADWAVPQVGWTLTVNSTTVTIEEITSDASFVYMTLSGFVSLPMTGNITLEEGGGVQPDIWVQQAWGVTSGIEGLTVTQDTGTTIVGKNLTQGNDSVGSKLKVSLNEIGLEQYLDPDGINNNQYGRVRVTSNGVQLEVSEEIVGATAYSRLDIVPAGIAISNTDGVSTNTFLFEGSSLVIPANGLIEQRNSFTRTTNSTVDTTPGVIWTGALDRIATAKLNIQVECNEQGDVSGWHTQACEAIIAERYWGISGVGDPIITVYGIIHTSTQPLMTFEVQRNSMTHKIEIVGTPTAAAATGSIYVKVYSVEMMTRD